MNFMSLGVLTHPKNIDQSQKMMGVFQGFMVNRLGVISRVLLLLLFFFFFFVFFFFLSTPNITKTFGTRTSTVTTPIDA